MIENWLQKIKLGSDNLSIYSWLIIIRKEEKNYVFHTNRFSNSLEIHQPEDVTVIESDGILKFKKDDGLLDWLVAVKNDSKLEYEPNIKPELFKEFIYRELKKKPKDWRDGQFVFNFLDTIIPGLSRELQFEKHIDCFYSDKNIPEFLDKALELMEEKIWL